MVNELQVIAPRGIARAFSPDELVGEWRAHLAELVAAGEKAAATERTYRTGMSKFLAWAGAQDGRIGPSAIREWKAALAAAGMSASTTNTWLAAVKHFFAWATSEGKLAYNPTAGVRGVNQRRRNHRREALADAEVLRVLAQPDASTTAGKRDRAILHLMAFCGLRSIEVQRARIGDLSGERLYVRGKGAGGDTAEAVYIVAPELVDALYSWLAAHPRGRDPQAPLFVGLGNRNHGQALSLAAIRRLVKGYYAAAGVLDARKSTHSLRHSFVTNLIKSGVAPAKIKSATRHASLDTLMLYVHELDRDTDPAEAHVHYAARGPW